MPNPERLKSEQVQDKILHWVQSGRFQPGQRLPSERSLASQLNVNHLTLRRGLAELAAAGVIEKRPKVGTFVAQVAPPIPVVVALPRWIVRGKTPHPYWNRILGAVHVTLDQQRYALTTLSYRPGRFWEDVGCIAVQRRARGVLLQASNDTTVQDVERLMHAEIKLVLLSAKAKLTRLGPPSVQYDGTNALEQAIEHLAVLGHRRVAVGVYTHNSQRRRDLGQLETMRRRHGLGLMPDMLIDLPNAPGLPDYGPLSEVFERDPSPTAVVVPDETAASALLRTCYLRGVRVPDDLSVVALLDSTPDHHAVPLSAPDTPRLADELGRRAAEALEAQLKGDTITPSVMWVRGDIQWKDSTAPPPRHTAGPSLVSTATTA